MSSVKLRKRRPTTGNNDSLLPQYTTATTAQGGRLAGGRQGAKRRRRPRSYTRLGVACLGFLLVVLLLVWDPAWLPTPQHPAVHRARAYTKKQVSSVLDQVQRQQHRRHASSNASYERITCADGTTGYLNDDYCDCADGSDELQTAACAHVLLAVPHFVCHGNATLKMYASRVRDGVRDCPDGSDEF